MSDAEQNEPWPSLACIDAWSCGLCGPTGSLVGYSSSLNVIGDLNYQIQNGKRVLLWPEHVAEGKFIPMPRWEDKAKK